MLCLLPLIGCVGGGGNSDEDEHTDEHTEEHTDEHSEEGEDGEDEDVDEDADIEPDDGEVGDEDEDHVAAADELNNSVDTIEGDEDIASEESFVSDEAGTNQPSDLEEGEVLPNHANHSTSEPIDISEDDNGLREGEEYDDGGDLEGDVDEDDDEADADVDIDADSAEEDEDDLEGESSFVRTLVQGILVNC